MRARWNEAPNKDLRSSVQAAFNGVNMAKNSLVDLQDVIEADVVVPKSSIVELELAQLVSWVPT